jgi:uncharacterized membrane protein YhaH (DUF805 family)
MRGHARNAEGNHYDPWWTVTNLFDVIRTRLVVVAVVVVVVVVVIIIIIIIMRTTTTTNKQ